MKINEVIESDFVRSWIAYELKQYGAKERAAYVVYDDDPQRHVLVATNLGLLDLRTERADDASLSFSGHMSPWAVVGTVGVWTETQHSPDGGFAGQIWMKIETLGIEVQGPRGLRRDLQDFVRECLRASAKARR